MTDNNGYTPTEKMLTPTTLAEMLEISERHLTDVRREDPTFPLPVLLGTLPRWSPAVIRRWMDRPTVTPFTDDRQEQTGKPVVDPMKTKRSTNAKGAQRVH